MDEESVQRTRGRRRDHPRKRAVSRMSAAVIAVLAIIGGPLAAAPAWADGGQSTEEGYVMVLQAVSYLVNSPGGGTVEAIAMVDDALAAADQDGVDVAVLREGRTALEEGRIDEGRALLEKSIIEAVTDLPPATGEESGTTQVLPPFSPEQGLSLTDWVFLGLSALVAAIGIFLAVLFRPTESLRELSRDIASAKAAHRAAARPTSKEA